MAYGIYVTVNGVRRQYPLIEVDGDAMYNDAKQGFSSIAITPAAPDSGETALTAYYSWTSSPLAGFGYFTDPITDPRSTDQVCYWPEDTEKACFEEVTLTEEPDDWTLSGIPDLGVGTLKSINALYYSYIVSVADQWWYDRAPTTFAAGTYLKNSTLNAFIQTEKNYFLGCTFGKYLDTWPPGDNYYFYVFGQLWAANQAWVWDTLPQYNYFDPAQPIGYNTNPDNFRDRSACDRAVSDPATPTDRISAFCRVTYNGEELIGVMFGTLDDGEINTCRMYLLPAWMWGEVTPYNPEPPEPEIPDPQDYGPDSWAEGGGGTLTDSNDAPDAPDDEQLLGGGFQQAYGMHIYRVGTTEFDTLMDALYGSGADWNALWNRWQNYKYSPISGIISSHWIPYHLCSATISTANIRVAGYAVPNTASIQMEPVQIHTTTIGSLSVPEFFGNAFDYSPYTRMRLYLPFCGWIDLDPDRVVGGSLTVKYKTDCASGNCCAYVICTDRTGSDTYMYTATGNCAVSLPIAGNDQGTGSIIGGIMTAATGALTGNLLGAAGGVAAALTAKHTQHTSGSYGGSSSLVTDRQCRLQIIRPVLTIPQYGQQLRGRPSEVGVEISQLVGTGWNSFNAVHPDIEGATADECAEITRLLSEGVIL